MVHRATVTVVALVAVLGVNSCTAVANYLSPSGDWEALVARGTVPLEIHNGTGSSLLRIDRSDCDYRRWVALDFSDPALGPLAAPGESYSIDMYRTCVDLKAIFADGTHIVREGVEFPDEGVYWELRRE